ncbi:MAG: SDR family oxidoreductase [Pirellulaceae bacterium]|jgi:nucleoside-diphosphate-sugar epimerase|nr:SDR family oxidoreductase [Pirellulaceae bacterium]
MRRLIAGCGYLGSRVARLWQAAGDDVHVLTRSAARAGHLHQLGLRPLQGDVTDPATLPPLPVVDTVLWSVGFDRRAGGAIHDVYVSGLRHVLQRLPAPTVRIVYVSSTGVFGETDGSWVDETTVCRPQRAGGRACLDAEQLLLQTDWARRTVILRLAGIYGPGRLPRLNQLRAGRPLDAAPDGLLNLIHVDDAAHVVQLVADRPLPLPRVYLVSDGHPVQRGDFYAEAARLLNTQPPVFERPVGATDALGRSGGHKRVSNQRMRSELNPTLQFRSYREGLADIARAERDSSGP